MGQNTRSIGVQGARATSSIRETSAATHVQVPGSGWMLLWRWRTNTSLAQVIDLGKNAIGRLTHGRQ